MTYTPLRIVLAEDDRLMRKAAETALTRGGFRVSSAADGEEALRLVRAEIPDLVILDLIMPKLQGFEVLKSLKEDPNTSGIPVIILSSLSQDQDKQEAMSSGAFAFFNKGSLSLGELVSQAREIANEAKAK